MTASFLKILVICAAAGALAAAHVAYRGLSWTVDRSKVQERNDRIDQVKGDSDMKSKLGFRDVEELKKLMAAGNVVFIDARPREQYEKAHLKAAGDPPTLNVEPEHAAAHIDRLMQIQAQPIVIYCNSEQCTLSEELIVELRPYGFNMRFFIPGWDGIDKAKLPTTSGRDTWDPLGTGAAAGGAPHGADAGQEAGEGENPAQSAGQESAP